MAQKAAAASSSARRSSQEAPLAVKPDTPPMEAKLVDSLPAGEGWQFEPKWDGFRCLVFRNDGALELRAKSGKPLSRFFPEVVSALLALPVRRFVVDGELAIPVGDSLSFDALQLRLHPAESRVRRLANQTPAVLILFDCLLDGDGRSLLDAPLCERRGALEAFFSSLRSPGLLRLSPYTRSRKEAQRWLDSAGGALDGVVAKRIDGPYASGERAMLKVKRMRTADCVVGGFRYESDGDQVGSLLLGLYDTQGKLHHVGFVSSIATRDRPALTKQLEKLIERPGFTGSAPGAPSRWSTARSSDWEPLKPTLVAEVRYDHVSGDRFRHGAKFVRWRPDKAPRQCTFEQLQAPLRAGKLVREALHRDARRAR
ncbi:MAG TPA: ATP-dependent DNA ligase [Steroidobacter sp.]|jgi:ATP-dependent DNA ligase|nr:ATP-dependent DNA ligase [Steroidobacter sp.]